MHRTLFLSLILLVGCVGNSGLSTSGEASNNIYNLSRISIGMSEAQVLAIMRHPYSQKTFEHEGDAYDVWFYVTRPTAIGQTRLVPQNLTPLTFKNGVLIGWGFDHYNYLLKQEEIARKVGTDAPPPPKVEEDIDLEKALKAPPKPKGQPPQKVQPPQQAPAPQPAPTSPKAPAQTQPKPKTPEAPPPPKAPAPQQKKGPSAPGPEPLQPPVQPVPQQPAAPVQPAPGTEPPLSMCSRPAQSTPPQDETEEEPAQRGGEKESDYLDEKGDEMLDEENQQNFDFW